MNPPLFFNNKKYISSKDASILVEYRHDYVGQLCRFGEVDSQKIGHTWYVCEESIIRHKNSKRNSQIYNVIYQKNKYIWLKWFAIAVIIVLIFLSIFVTKTLHAQSAPPRSITTSMTNEQTLDKASVISLVGNRFRYNFNNASIATYKVFHHFFDSISYQSLVSFFIKFQKNQPATMTAQVLQLPLKKTIKTSVASQSTGNLVKTSSAPSSIVEKIIKQPVENTYNYVGISPDELNRRLQELDNKITSQLASMSTGSGNNVTNIYNEIAGSQRIDQLTNTTINTPNINGGSINGTSISASNISASTVSITSTSASSTFANGINLTSGCFSVNGTCITSGGGGGGGGITSLSAQYSASQSGSSQTLATSSDTNLGLTIISLSNTHTFTPTWSGTLATSRGGTGQNFSSANGILNFYSGVASPLATSSLGLLTTNVAEGSNLYYTQARFDTAFSAKSTTNLAEGSNLYFTNGRVDTEANSYINASTTIPKTYTGNIFTALQTLNNGLTVSGQTSLQNASTTQVGSTGSAYFATTGGNLGIGTTTPGSLLSVQGVANFTTATSTLYSTGGFNLTKGCFAIAGTCLSSGGGGGTPGGSNTQVQFNNSSAFGGSSNFIWDNTNNKLGLGATTTPYATLSVNSSAGVTPFVVGSSTATSFIIDSSGNVGIGLTNPTALLSFPQSVSTSGGIAFGTDLQLFRSGFGGMTLNSTVNSILTLQAGVGGYSSFFKLAATSGGFNYIDQFAGGALFFRDQAFNTIMTLMDDGNSKVGLSTTSPWRTLSVTGTVGFDGLTSATTGNYLCINTTTKEITSGTTCTLSSERFKTDIASLVPPALLPTASSTSPTSALEEVMALRPVTFKFKTGYGDNGQSTQLGFIAEEAMQVDPRLVPVDKDGIPNGFYYQNYTAVLTKAIQEININIQAIASSTATSTSQSQSFADSFWKNIFNRVGQWLADATNGLTNIFAKKIHTNILCVSDDSGAETCVNKAQLDSLLISANRGLNESPVDTNNATTTYTPTATTTTTINASSTPPIISTDSTSISTTSLIISTTTNQILASTTESSN